MAAARSHRIASVVFGTLGVLFIFAAVLLGYARRSVFDQRAFSARIAAGLEDPGASAFVSDQLTDVVIKANPDLVGVRPMIAGVTRSVVSSAPFRAAVRRSAHALHRAIMSGTASNLVLTVKDVGAVFQSATSLQPELAEKLPRRAAAALARLDSLPSGERVVWLIRLGHRLRALVITLLVLGIGLCAWCVWVSPEKRRTLLWLGLAHTALGFVLAIVARFGGNAFPIFLRDHEMAPVLSGLAKAFLGGLMVWAVVLGLAGLVLASASASLLDRILLNAWGRKVTRWLFGPLQMMRHRLARGILGAMVGASILFWPLPSLIIAAWLCGLVLAFVGLREAFAVALHLLPELASQTEERPKAPHGILRRSAFVLGGTLALAVWAVSVWRVLRSPDVPAIADSVTAYNGSPELGGETLDQVVFPATHNSMGSPDVPGWMFPNQSASIKSQLEDGIRAFLIDIHFGVPAGDHVRTELDEQGSLEKYEAEVGPEGVAAALRIRDRLTGKESGERDVYLCHGFCELGALRFVTMLEQVRTFLVANPGEVLIFVIQDEHVPPQDIARCFEDSGLIDYVYRGPARPPWPTLREMVESDERVVVMTESGAPGVDWLHSALEVMQETPYAFHHPAEFSNRPNRGGTAGSLLLMNHWIDTTPMPKPSNADSVNTHDFLLRRIRAFQQERGRIPNLVAVDFYRVGDLVPLVRELNAELKKPARN